MKNRIYKLLSILLVLAMILSTLTCAVTTVWAVETVTPTMVQGTIDNKKGEIMPDISTRIYTQDLITIADYKKLALASGYKGYYHFYNASGTWIGHSGDWITGDVTIEQLIAISPTAVYFRAAIGRTNDSEFKVADFSANALVLTKAAQPETAVTVEPTMTQGTISNNEGQIYPTNGTRVYTKYLLLISDYSNVTLATGYKAYYHFYDAGGNWVGHSYDWIEGGLTITQIRAMAGSAVNFGIVVATTGNNDLLVEDFPSGVLTLTLASGLKAPTGAETPIAPEVPEPEIPKDLNVSSPKMAQGTIIDKTGEILTGNTTRIYTEELIPMADYEMVKIAKGYKGWFHCYDADGNRINCFGWKEAVASDLHVAMEEVKTLSPTATYFRVVIATLDDATITPSNFSNGISLIKDSAKYSDFTNEVVFEIGPKVNGPWQEGAIFDGKLFLLNHDEWGKTYDLATGEIIGNFTCDRTDFFSVHSNSICFGTEYYDENDKYPLMYICVYNNYAGHANQYEGHCGVYRIIEDGSDFKGELVQVIRIGFTENMDMWKSLPNRGDVCPFGNFIVDTDKNDLYAYVMRDATQTTRYYKFDLPKVSDGEYNSLFGCKTVTLDIEDIKDYFDTEYSVYLQGADYLDGMILSSSGLGHDRAGGAILRLVDLETKTVIKTFDAVSAGVIREPEVIAVDPNTKKVYYGSTDGQLRWLTCIDDFRAQARFTGLREEGGNWYYYYENGKKTDKTALVKHDGKWCYVENGVWNGTEAHSFVNYVSNNDATCINNCTETALCEYDGCNATDIREIENSTVAHKFTFYSVKDTAGCGKNATEIAECDYNCGEKDIREVKGSALNHIYDGDTDAQCNECGAVRSLRGTGLYKEEGVWYYYEDGVKSGVTTLVKVKGKWFYIEKGVWAVKTALVKYSGKWFYVKNGKWDRSINDLVKYKDKWFLIKNGKWDSSAKTLFKKNNKWFAIKSGKWYKGETFITYSGKKFYVKDGFAQLKFSGKVTIGGKKYTIKAGKVV